MIGISVNGRAVAGAVGVPFPRGVEGFAADCDDASACSVTYGLVGTGAESDAGFVGECNGHHREASVAENVKKENDDRFIILTGDSSNATLAAAVATAFDVTNNAALKIFGGAGSKLLRIVEHIGDCALMQDTTCLWDTCAPEALVKAAGGRVTDLFGSPLCHSSRARTLENLLGVIATVPNGPIVQSFLNLIKFVGGHFGIFSKTIKKFL